MLSPQKLRRQLDVEPFQVQSQIEHLIDALSDPGNPHVRRAAAVALGQLRAPPGVDEAHGRRCVGPRGMSDDGQTQSDGQRAVKPLVAALQDPVEMVRIAAATSLGRIGASEAVMPLLDFLKHSSVAHRRSAAEALGNIGDPRAVESLVAALKDTDHQVCITALEALGRIGDRRAVEALIAALGHRDTCVRLTAAAALNEINGAARIPARSLTVASRAPLPRF